MWNDVKGDTTICLTGAGSQVQCIFTVFKSENRGDRAGGHIEQVTGYVTERVGLVEIGGDGRINTYVVRCLRRNGANTKYIHWHTAICTGFCACTLDGHAIIGIFSIQSPGFLVDINFIFAHLFLLELTIAN